MARELAGKLPVEVIDLASDGGEALANRYRVFQVPTVILVNDAGVRLEVWPRVPFAVEVLEEVEARGS